MIGLVNYRNYREFDLAIRNKTYREVESEIILCPNVLILLELMFEMQDEGKGLGVKYKV